MEYVQKMVNYMFKEKLTSLCAIPVGYVLSIQ